VHFCIIATPLALVMQLRTHTVLFCTRGPMRHRVMQKCTGNRAAPLMPQLTCAEPAAAAESII
jgi:hypothetical protein